MPEGFLSTPPGRRRRAGNHRPAGRAAGQLRHAGSGARIRAVPHRGLGHHAGDVDAAHVGAPRPDRRHRPLAFGANGIRRHVRERTGGTGRTHTTATGCRCAPPGPTAGSTCPRSADEVPDWRERQTWACGPEAHAQRRSALWSSAGIGERLAPRAVRRSRGGRCTVPAAPSRSNAAARPLPADAATSLMDAGEQVGVRMPFGCRMGICQSCVVQLDRRPRSRSADGCRTRAGKSGTDVHLRSFRRLCTGRLTFTGR